MMTPKIIYYYQTFTGLQNILKQDTPKITHIHVSSFHFGINKDKSNYIHLNNNPPNSPMFNSLWKELKQAHEKGIKIIIMIGGAGGGFETLFSNFEIYYKLLQEVIREYYFIAGIDLDVEESIGFVNITTLIQRIYTDYGSQFIISMAPLAASLIHDNEGMGGFSYKKLYKSPQGKMIHYFNGQFYGCFDALTYNSIISNGYPASKIVIGMLSQDFSYTTFGNALQELRKIKYKYNSFGGIFVWEYFNCPPGSPEHPEDWCEIIYKIIIKNKKD